MFIRHLMGVLREQVNDGSGSPPVAPVVAAPPAPPVTPPAAPVADPANTGEPPADADKWLPARLARERNALLKKFGVDSEEQLTERLKKAKELEDAQLSEQERTQRLLAELTPKAQEADELRALLSASVDTQFNALPEAARNAIDAVANGDPRERIKLIGVMQAAGLGAAPTPPVNTAPPVAPPVSAGNAGTPPPRPSGVQSMFEQWEAITDPVARTLFYRVHSREIEGSRSA
jgi:hypothetical protein